MQSIISTLATDPQEGFRQFFEKFPKNPEPHDYQGLEEFVNLGGIQAVLQVMQNGSKDFTETPKTPTNSQGSTGYFGDSMGFTKFVSILREACDCLTEIAWTYIKFIMNTDFLNVLAKIMQDHKYIEVIQEICCHVMDSMWEAELWNEDFTITKQLQQAMQQFPKNANIQRDVMNIFNYHHILTRIRSDVICALSEHPYNKSIQHIGFDCVDSIELRNLSDQDTGSFVELARKALNHFPYDYTLWGKILNPIWRDYIYEFYTLRRFHFGLHLITRIMLDPKTDPESHRKLCYVGGRLLVRMIDNGTADHYYAMTGFKECLQQFLFILPEYDPQKSEFTSSISDFMNKYYK